MRTYKQAGQALFLCQGHPELDNPGTDGDGHHMIAIAWAPGCVHIEDHAEPILRGCDRGCAGYIRIAGDDPFSAEIEES